MTLQKIIISLTTSLLLVRCAPTMNSQTLKVGTGSITAEVVSSPKQMAKGLSGRASMAADRGMLFLYAEPTTPQFWMKGMNFPIDIVWLRQGKVIGIEQRVPADDGDVRYSPLSQIDAVLELVAGASKSSKLSEGDPLDYKR